MATAQASELSSEANVQAKSDRLKFGNENLLVRIQFDPLAILSI